MPYNPQTWANDPVGGTSLSATRLNFIEAGIDDADTRITTHEATANPHTGSQPLDTDLTSIAALDSATAGAISSDGVGWIKKTYAQFKTALGLVKADVGLGLADNTADSAKPTSTAQAAYATSRAVALAIVLGG